MESGLSITWPGGVAVEAALKNPRTRTGPPEDDSGGGGAPSVEAGTR